ncbi:MAG TPA: hypothetical protein VJZ49_09040 [Syntrophales bacterium]|nr:hypothetical protein [Syntrophales bacterium]
MTFRAVETSATVRTTEKKEQLPAKPSLRENKDVSWIVILMQFFAVNALIIAHVVLGLFI